MIFLLSILFLITSCGSEHLSNPSESTLTENPLIVISDIDDTLRITAVKHPLSLIRNGLKQKNITFMGMNDLLKTLSKENSETKFYYLTAAQKIPVFNFFKIVRNSIKNDGFPEGPFIGRELGERDITGYKIAEHSNIIEQHLAEDSRSEFIFLGDDTQHDQKVYEALIGKYPDVKIKFFIHLVENKAGKEIRDYHFVTAADLGAKLFEMSRITLSSAQAMYFDLNKKFKKYRKRIIPDWSSCKGFSIVWSKIREAIFFRESVATDDLTTGIMNHCAAHG